MQYSWYTIEKHTPYSNITKKEGVSCNGYNFKGWEIITTGVQKVNTDVFIMPEKDVTLRGLWTKQSIEKSMDGTIKEDKSFIELLDKLKVSKEFIHGKLLTELIILLSKIRFFRFGKDNAILKSL